MRCQHLTYQEQKQALQGRYAYLQQQQESARVCGDAKRWASLECDIRNIKRLIDQIDRGAA